MSTTKEDPRDASLCTKFTLPPTWYKEATDGLGSSGMFLSGLIMVTRNRFLAWPATLFAISGLINQHPMRSKDGGSGGLSNLLLCVSALFASYLPMIVVQAPKVA